MGRYSSLLKIRLANSIPDFPSLVHILHSCFRFTHPFSSAQPNVYSILHCFRTCHRYCSSQHLIIFDSAKPHTLLGFLTRSLIEICDLLECVEPFVDVRSILSSEWLCVCTFVFRVRPIAQMKRPSCSSKGSEMRRDDLTSTTECSDEPDYIYTKLTARLHQLWLIDRPRAPADRSHPTQHSTKPYSCVGSPFHPMRTILLLLRPATCSAEDPFVGVEKKQRGS
jgi:hypothetical protein